MKQDKTILARIEYLAKVGGNPGDRDSTPSDLAREVYVGTLGLASSLYGANSPQVEAIKDSNDRISKHNWSQGLRDTATIHEMRGVLRTIRAEIENGLLDSIRTTVKGEILSDFLLLAQQSLRDSKDVAAVLACAALEDALKRFAEANGLECDDKEMTDVVNALKARGLVQGAQGKVLQSFVGVRNKALHAQWDRIDGAEVHAVIGFLQTFLSDRFS